MIMKLKLKREEITYVKNLYHVKRDFYQLMYQGLFQPVLGAQLMKQL